MLIGDLDHLHRPGEGFVTGSWETFRDDRLVADLDWPDDVVEQFLYDHGKKDHVRRLYGHLDLTRIVWAVERLSLEQLLNVKVPWVEGRQAVAQIEREPLTCLRLYERSSRPTGWKAAGSWTRPPVLLEASAIARSDGLLLVEGHTRMGFLRGLARAKFKLADGHDAWVGRQAA